jgi:hypothetical protein
MYAIIDCAVDDNVERTGVPKILWMLIIILLPYFGPLAWLAVSKFARPRTHNAAGWGSPSALPRRAPRRLGPIAPDDNADFLRQLADEQLRRERERRRRDKPDGKDSDPPAGSK